MNTLESPGSYVVELLMGMSLGGCLGGASPSVCRAADLVWTFHGAPATYRVLMMGGQAMR